MDAEDLAKVKLAPWEDELNREAFSLEAIAVLSKLSLLDEPLIIVFDQLEGLGRQQNRVLLENFGEAIKEIFTHVPNSLIIFNLFPNRWIQMRDEIFDGAIIDRMSQYVIQLEHPSKENLKAILQEKLNSLDLSLETLFDSQELDDILGQPSIRAAINRAAAYYRHKIHDIALSPQSRKQWMEPSVVHSRKLINNNGETTEHRLERIEADIGWLKEKIEVLFSNQSMGSTLTVRDLPKEPTVDPNLEILRSYMDQQRQELGARYDRLQLIHGSDDLGKLWIVASEFQNCELFEIQKLRLGNRVLPANLLIQNSQKGNVLAFLHANGSSFTARIKNFNKLVSSHSDFNFVLMRDVRESTIRGKVGKFEIERLNHMKNGRFVYLQREDRIELELIYTLVVDIQNQDLDISFEKAFSLLRWQQPKHWILEKLFLQD
ncbi:hypothetical protein [Leptolyngbya ectocarpi]|uniref:hypothetical protein n=1 Tax=Leptolyngbya ectocarpi TaxID=1202 RepID=UPI00187FD5D8|nr:hypothetical protein [Leptolyngbya ectocarpi]